MSANYLMMLILVFYIGSSSSFPSEDKALDVWNKEPRQWDSTCSYWRWSKCRGKANQEEDDAWKSAEALKKVLKLQRKETERNKKQRSETFTGSTRKDLQPRVFGSRAGRRRFTDKRKLAEHILNLLYFPKPKRD